MKNEISKETQNIALNLAKANQKPGQTKQQTKLIAQGIEKGIAEYKKQHKIKAREKDKQKKQLLKQKEIPNSTNEQSVDSPQKNSTKLPWILLIISWVIFIFIYVINH